MATAAVIWHDQKILIAQREKDEFWEFPGGKIDPGETPKQCLIREIKEELDLDIELGAQFKTVEGYFRFQDMVLYGFHSVFTGGQLKLNVHLDAKWVKVKQLQKYSFVEEDRQIVSQILEDQRNWEFRQSDG